MYPNRRKRDRYDRADRSAPSENGGQNAPSEAPALRFEVGTPSSGARAGGRALGRDSGRDSGRDLSSERHARHPSDPLPPAGLHGGVFLPQDDDSQEDDKPEVNVTREDVEALISLGVAPVALIARFPDIAQAPASEIPGWGLVLIRRTNPTPGSSRYLYVADEGVFHVQPMYGGVQHLVARVERAYGHVVHDAVSVSSAQKQQVMATYARVDVLLGGTVAHASEATAGVRSSLQRETQAVAQASGLQRVEATNDPSAPPSMTGAAVAVIVRRRRLATA